MNSQPLKNIWNPLPGELHSPQFSGVVTRIHSMDGPKPKSSAEQRKVVAPRQAPADDFVSALGHGIALLECWHDRDVWLTNADLSERSGLRKSTVSRLASVLVGLGYLSRDKLRGRLRLTAKTLELGFGSAFASEPVGGIRPELARLATDLDVYASLGIRRVDKVQVVDNVASPLHPDAVPMDVGGLLPICRSASGLAVLSALPEAEAVPLMERLRAYYGARWQAMQSQLNRTKEEYSSKGYCTAIASLSRNVAAVAVPILPYGGDDIFVLGCGMPAVDFYRERVEQEIVPEMLRVAQDLQATFKG